MERRLKSTAPGAARSTDLTAKARQPDAFISCGALQGTAWKGGLQTG